MAEKENSWLENLGNEMFMKERDKINSEFDKEIGRLYVKGADIGQIPLGGFAELSVNRLRELCLVRIDIDETLISKQGKDIDDSQAKHMVAHIEDVLANQFSRSLGAVTAAAHAGGLEKAIADVKMQLEKERKKILEDMKREINIRKGLSRLSASAKERKDTKEEKSVTERPPLSQYDYDIAVSFAGEDREIVEQYCEILRSEKLRVFYDKYEQVDLWGKDLYERLDNVYRNKAVYCVIFISKSYAGKVWTTHERKSAQARALQENREYILPVRLDDTEIPGILPTIAHIDLRHISVEKLAEMTIQKLKQLKKDDSTPNTGVL